MRTSRSIDFHKFTRGGTRKPDSAKHKGNRLSIPLFSAFFSSVTDNVMCTNAMYGNLYKEIESTLSVYSEKESVSLTVYESSSSGEDVKESIVVGFRKYITQCVDRAKNSFKMHLFTFTALCVIGVLIEFLLYGAFPDFLPLWLQNVLDIVAWVFVWQFAAYMTFEFVKEIKAIRRLRQILNADFIFRHWE